MNEEIHNIICKQPHIAQCDGKEEKIKMAALLNFQIEQAGLNGRNEEYINALYDFRKIAQLHGFYELFR